MAPFVLASLAISAFLVPHPTLLQHPAGRAFVTMCDGDATVDERSPKYRQQLAEKRAADAEARRSRAAEMTPDAGVIDALTEASKSLEPCYTGDLEECPDALKSKFTQLPLDFFACMRNPEADPDAGVWPGARDRWPVLASLSDDDLLCLLQPIKDIRVDKRSLM